MKCSAGPSQKPLSCYDKSRQNLKKHVMVGGTRCLFIFIFTEEYILCQILLVLAQRVALELISEIINRGSYGMLQHKFITQCL